MVKGTRSHVHVLSVNTLYSYPPSELLPSFFINGQNCEVSQEQINNTCTNNHYVASIFGKSKTIKIKKLIVYNTYTSCLEILILYVIL